MKDMKKFKSGFIAVVGRPNVGKSTLVNKIVGQKVSAVSDKPNTTRNRITGIKTLEDCQLIFLDTPGIHKPRGKLGRNMVQTAYGVLSECDLIMMVTDVDRLFRKGDTDIFRNLPKPAVLVINKIDKIKKHELLEMLKSSERFADKILEVIPVSALKDDGIAELVDILKDNLPEGEKYFPDEMYTDQPEKFLVAEIVREKIFNLTRHEIPYKTAVLIEQFKEDPGKNIINIHALVLVERSSHKAIVIGKDGRMLKQVGTEAREEIEKILGIKVYLEIWVKVKEKWSEKESYLSELGYKS